MLIDICRKSHLIFSLLLILSAVNASVAGTPIPATRVLVIDKAKKDLVVLVDGRQVAQFPAAFGIDPDSDKYKVFDCATPEGLYFITHKKAKSRFYRLLGISYPNPAKAEKGLVEGTISLKEYKTIQKALQRSRPVPCNTGLGCGIAIHGGGVFNSSGKAPERDWTRGCIALNNPDMEKLFNFCRFGDPVVIFNSRRNLYGIVRPFTRIKDLDENGTPRCPNEVCTYQVEIPSRLGRMTVTIKEGKAYGRSLQVMANTPNDPEKPILVLVDQNADGRLSPMDSANGPLADEHSPDAAYKMVREAIIAALSRGDIISIRDRTTIPRP